jgi:molybdenum cofactor biosynthesis protein B
MAGRPLSDVSGDLIAKTLKDQNNRLVSRTLVPDNAEEIRNALGQALARPDVMAIIICGGTGISPRDLTIEAVSPLLTKDLPGFGELFRKLSYDQIGSPAIMTRAIAGVIDKKVVFCIPGSVNAVRLCLNNLILPETGHIVKHVWESS